MTATPSTTGRRRAGRSKGDLREEQILEAVRLLLTEKSMAAVTIDDITTAAGISRTAFYFYFPSKHAVLARLMEQVDDRFLGTHSWLGTDGPNAAGLHELLRGAATIWRENAAILSCSLQDDVAAAYPPLEEFMARAYERFTASLAAKIARDQDAGVAPSGIAPRRLAEMVESLRGARLNQLAALPESEVPAGLDELAEAVLRLIYGRV